MPKSFTLVTQFFIDRFFDVQRLVKEFLWDTASAWRAYELFGTSPLAVGDIDALYGSGVCPGHDDYQP